MVIVHQASGFTFQRNIACFQYITMTRKLQGKLCILFNQNNGNALAVNFRKKVGDFPHDVWCKA